jgi:hypothetical protein
MNGSVSAIEAASRRLVDGLKLMQPSRISSSAGRSLPTKSVGSWARSTKQWKAPPPIASRTTGACLAPFATRSSAMQSAC